MNYKFMNPAKIISVIIFLFMFANISIAQSSGDICHVYVVDVEKASNALENFKETGNEEADQKALTIGQTIFPEFRTEFEEEQLTTKHYNFPGSKFIITASVYYTDESMASHPYGKYEASDQSILIGVMVSNKPQNSAISLDTLNSAVTEVTYDDYTNMVRAKQYVKVSGRRYLVGIQCDCAAKRKVK